MNKVNPGSRSRAELDRRAIKKARHKRRREKRAAEFVERLKPIMHKINHLEHEIKKKNLLIDTLKKEIAGEQESDQARPEETENGTTERTSTESDS